MSANWLYESDEPDDLLEQIVTLEKKWQGSIEIDSVHEQINEHLALLSTKLDSNKSRLQNLYAVIDVLYDELAFSGAGLQLLPESSLNNVSFCLMYRTGNQLSMSVVIRHLLKKLGLNAFIAELNSEIALVVKLSNSELIVMDVITGATEYLISSDDVKTSLVNEIASFAKEVPNEEIIKEVLTEQKLACLEEGLFNQALLCVETLMDLLPEDPYERRDRGLVLQQLDCAHWAKDDFDYFIKACPNDPMAMFIKLQLEETALLQQTIH